MKILVISVLALSVLVSTAFAQWQVDGIKLAPAAEKTTISDGSGGVLCVFTGGSDNDIYVQRIDASGNLLWTPSGALACNAPGMQIHACIAPDGTGGAIVAWVDFRTGGIRNVYAQRLNSAGVPQWTANGVQVSAPSGPEPTLDIMSDGAGGAIIAWCDQRNGTFDIFAQRLNASGIKQWTLNDIAVCDIAGDQTAPVLSTGAHGTVLCWTDQRPGTPGYYVQSLDASGTPQWTVNGIRIGGIYSLVERAAIASDGAGGAVVAWTNENQDIVAQRLDTGGIVWGSGGVAVCTIWERQIKVAVSSVPGGGVDIVWSDWRNFVPEVYAQRLSIAGVAAWTTDGVLISPTLKFEGYHAMVSSAGGTYIAWSYGNYAQGNDANINVQKLDASGTPQWGPVGVAICIAPNGQFLPDVVLGANGGIISTWIDHRAPSGPYPDVYAEGVSSTGEPYAFVVMTTADIDDVGSLRAAIRQANELPGAQTISFNIPGAGVHTIRPTSSLPIVTDPVTIDGFTQPGALPNSMPAGVPCDAQIMIELDGSQFGSPQGFQFAASDCTLRGVAMFGIYTPVSVSGPNAVIEGNYFGFGADGQPFPYNPGNGVFVSGSNCRVGGADEAARNVIGGMSSGIQAYGANGLQVYGNYFGINPDLSTAQPNSIGVWLINTSGAKIGSSVLTLTPTPAESNIISHDINGVIIEGAGSMNNMVIRNSFFGTSQSAIDLGFDGPTYNDRGDFDSGPNNLQNQPVITAISASQIDGFTEGTVGQVSQVHFYRSSTCSSSGRGNAETYIGGVTVGGLGAFSFHPAQPLAPGSMITCTSTDLAGNTSELTSCLEYQNTGSGSNITVDLVDESGNTHGTATYANVTSPGNTYTTNPYTPPVPVSGYSIGNPNDPQIYFNITTDASYTGGVDICLNYDENNIPGPEANLVLLHYEGSMWTNVTTSRDTVNNTICGHVTSLSPFVIGAVTTTGAEDTPLPTTFALHTNVPNPFNPITTISYDVPTGAARVSISVYDIAGRRVRTLVDEHRPAGVWSVQWNGDDDRGQRVASGVYFYRMRAGSFVATRKMVLLK